MRMMSRKGVVIKLENRVKIKKLLQLNLVRKNAVDLEWVLERMNQIGKKDLKISLCEE